MNRTRLLVGLVAAIVIAFFLSTYVYRQLRNASLMRPAATQNIVVAAVPLQIGARVDESNLKLISWPGGEPVSGMFTRIQDCANRALITPVAENEPILEPKLAPLAAGSGLPAVIPEGMRALSVAVNQVIGVAGFVIPNTMVDVLVTGQLKGNGQNGGSDNVTRTILENVRVLAAGQRVEQDREGKPETVSVITLLVSPEDADKLTMASTEGKIQLALRNTVDAKTVSPPAVVEAALFSGGTPAAEPTHREVVKAAPPPPAPYAVEVITGDKRATKTFENQ
jgi:pilus assembly protein CpaB